MDKKDYGTEAVQKQLLAMMKEVHAFFCSHDISYSLCGGSLLGAVRHNGFIPWDDDMDIMVNRENYNKLLRVMNELDGYSIDRELWVYRIRKITDQSSEDPPTIDIFVMDHCPENSFLRGIKVFLIKILQGMMKQKPNLNAYSPFYKICIAVTYCMGRLIREKTKFKAYERVSQIGNGKESRYVTAYDDLFKLLNIRYLSETMNDLRLHRFEDTEFYITGLFDSYLTKQYGDYMTPPPESERRPQHARD